MSENMGKCILVCAGDMGKEEIPYKEGDFLIAVDGGLEHVSRRGLVPDYILGDFDSLGTAFYSILADYRERHPEEITTLPVEKDDTDTIAAVRLGLERRYRDFVIYGGLGGKRLDHTLANIQTLAYLKKHGANGHLVGEGTELFILCNEKVTFDENYDGTVSFFALDPEVRDVTIRGMKYPLEKGTLHSCFPLGISNRVTPGIPASISVGEGLCLAVLTKE